MVSFSCDACQNVLTKPKVQNHFRSCRTRTVSCIDCSVVFDFRTVRSHSSCITEAEKHGPKKNRGTDCTQTYCGICTLSLHGAVHALQHYESKKHRANERRLKNIAKEKAAHTDRQNSTKEPSPPNKVEGGNGMKQDLVVNTTENTQRDCDKKSAGLKRAMKKVLKDAPKRTLKKKAFVKAIAELMGEKTPSDLAVKVEKKIIKSRRFILDNDRISLVAMEAGAL